ncbi:IS3 family transposase [Streptomyces gelaticus]|uniref:IS3 family transposase n=1 Tax=Streptomyces gelaticus TaxID=285446 RepID=UPI0037B18F7B
MTAPEPLPVRCRPPAPVRREALCSILGIARSSFYYWRRTAADRAARQAADAQLAARIRAVHRESDGTYGVPRITAELREEGERVNHKRIARVMRSINLAEVRLRRRHRTTVADPAAAKAPDLIARDFTASEPNTKYVGDITYLPLESGKFLYLATVIDLASRRLAGWAIADHMRTDLVTDALAAAEQCRGSLAGAVIHTDHGAQGGFNQSLQHLVLGGVDGQASRVDGSVDWTVANKVPGCAGASAGSGTSVLAGEREGAARRGGGSCGWRIPGGGLQVVPSRWRHATNGSCSAVRPVPVLSRA